MHTTSVQQPIAQHAMLVAGPDVWMESDAVDQLHRTASLAGCVRAIGMPDLHPGPGGPIGAAFAFSDRIYPSLLGSDAGCGARLVATSIGRMKLDALERRVRDAFDLDTFPWQDSTSVLQALTQSGVSGLANIESLPESLRRLAALESPEPDLRAAMDRHRDLLSPLVGHALGTIGGGNHFAEIVRVGRIADREVASDWGVRRDCCGVLIHSGARSLGKLLSDRFGSSSLQGVDADAFLSVHGWACRFARANRFLIGWRVLSAMGAARPDKVLFSVDCVHNQVERYLLDAREVWLHRKGAAPARRLAPTLLLGSRGASSWLMMGCGNQSVLESMAHGSGRRMTRSEALNKLKTRYTRASLQRTAMGGRVVCDETQLLYEEHPDAYKPAEAVLNAVVEARMAKPVASLDPMVTVKR
jgi:release factor H-coupled RctB family protein